MAHNLVCPLFQFGLDLWAVLVHGPFWTLLWAVLDILKIYGPFWFMGHFSINLLQTVIQLSVEGETRSIESLACCQKCSCTDAVQFHCDGATAENVSEISR